MEPTGSSGRSTPVKRALGPTVLWATGSFRPTQPLPLAGAELRGRDLQRATNDIYIAPRLAQSGAQSM